MAQSAGSRAFGGRTVPPATPPVINEQCQRDGRGDPLRTRTATAISRAAIRTRSSRSNAISTSPSRSPEQEVPGPGGDTDQPGRAPAETPPQPDQASMAGD